MRKIFKASFVVFSVFLCIALAACNNTPAEPSESPSATPIASPVVSIAPTASPEITTPDEPLTGTATDLVGAWIGVGDTVGAKLDFESAALISLTFMDIDADEMFSYSGPAVVEDGTITIADKRLGEDVAFPYSIEGKIVTITHNDLELTLEKQ